MLPMKILEKFTSKQNDYYIAGVPTIAFLGDSVTHGCFEIYVKNRKIETVVDPQSGYPEKLRTIFHNLYPDVPVNIINAGISGDTASNALNRLQRDVLNFNPDLVVVCFGLNDAMQGAAGLEVYQNALCEIFERLKSIHSEIIFMTPNLTSDKVEIPFSDTILDSAVSSVIENEREEWLNKYLESAKKVAENQNIPVCDCHAIWKILIKNGVNVNHLLSNRVNHPTRELHWLFAYELVKTIFNN